MSCIPRGTNLALLLEERTETLDVVRVLREASRPVLVVRPIKPIESGRMRRSGYKGLRRFATKGEHITTLRSYIDPDQTKGDRPDFVHDGAERA